MLPAVIMMLAVVAQDSARDAATFTRRVAEFDARAAAMERAPKGEPAAAAALAWLRALRGVLQAIPIEKRSGPHQAWLDAHEALIVYSEPAGEWLISNNLIDGVHRQYAASSAADDIAWLAVINGMPGECEGWVPCYAAALDQLQGEYLRLHPRGSHRVEAVNRINETLRIVVDDLLKRPERGDYLAVPADCGDLLNNTRPLRAAVIAANGAGTATVALIDRMLAQCPKQ